MSFKELCPFCIYKDMCILLYRSSVNDSEFQELYMNKMINECNKISDHYIHYIINQSLSLISENKNKSINNIKKYIAKLNNQKNKFDLLEYAHIIHEYLQ